MNYLLILKQHWLVLLIVTIVAGGAAVGLSLLPDQLYESQVDLLIVQRQKEYTDAYAAQKAAEKLGKNLINVIPTFDFLNRVIATGYVSPDIFSQSTKQRKQQWERLVQAQVIPETGIIRVYGYGVNPGLAEDVALGVTQVLTTNSADYHGGGEAVEIKHIDGPVTSTRPVKPNLVLNGLAAAALGFMLTSSGLVLRAEAKRVAAEKKALHYEAAPPAVAPPAEQPLFPVTPVEYKVLDMYPTEETGEPVSMEDHLHKE